jgi:glycosyltransferase involved in cell wall biosynthesis
MESEQDILSRNGHEHDLLMMSNHEITKWLSRLKTAINITYSKQSKKKMVSKLSSNNFDIVHVHNFFPLLTPSIYDACIEASVPVVQTLHNYRTICPGALLMRAGKICEKCITGSPYQAVLHRCYRNSFPGSWAVARMVAYHRKKQTWQNKVDRFIVLTQFGKKKFVEAGIPEGKITIKPNCYIDSKGVRGGTLSYRKGALFVGRLSEEKGGSTMLAAWQKRLALSLRIAGDGPLLDLYKNKRMPNVDILEQLTADQVSHEMRRASFLVMPSEWYEGFPVVLMEAFAHRLPVLASRLGSMIEIVENGITGLHFEAGNPRDLAEKALWMFEHPEECRRMGENARKVYEEKYTPETNYQQLMAIYRNVIEEHKYGRL